MPDRHIHVVSFNIPYPPTYGGVIDVYYKLKAFDEVGIKVHLHCFEYNRKQTKHLASICETVHYYKRNVSMTNLFQNKPYIVASRNANELLDNLCRDKYPILFEGLHTCFFLDHKRLKNRVKIVRMHNVEHVYYMHLARVEKNLFKRYYYYNEASKLKLFQDSLAKATGIAAISKNDANHFEKRYQNIKVIRPFHPYNFVNIKKGTGTYCLYHANLEIGENNEAALFLINKVFNDLPVPLVIAGHKPSAELREAVKQYKHISIEPNPSSEAMNKLVREAQIHVLPTFQATGVKLKLYVALYNCRHCITNKLMVKDTGLESLCHVVDDATEMKRKVTELMNKPFEIEDIEKRKELLQRTKFSNRHNISRLIKLLFREV